MKKLSFYHEARAKIDRSRSHFVVRKAWGREAPAIHGLSSGPVSSRCSNSYTIGNEVRYAIRNAGRNISLPSRAASTMRSEWRLAAIWRARATMREISSSVWSGS
jgi:hypothetical protein